MKLAFLVVVAAPIGIGCRHAPEGNLLPKAETLVLNAQWEGAIPVLKRHLLTHPNDPGAHFYLGRCYLNAKSKTPMMVFALGELETALNLFRDQGQPNTIDRFSDSYFELICHLERTKVYLKQTNFVLSQTGIAPSTRDELLAGILDRCDEELVAAKAIEPESPDVKNLEEIIVHLRQSLGLIRGRQKRPEPKAGFVL